MRRPGVVGEPMSSPSVAAYPRDREAEIALRDGSTVHVRPVRPEDKTSIREFLDGVSPESIGFRFFGAISLEWVTDWAIDVDYTNRFALVVETGTPKRIVAHAAYIRISIRRCSSRRTIEPAERGGCIPSRGRVAGTWHLDDPAGPPRSGRRATWDHDLLGPGAAVQPPDDRTVPQERLSDRGAFDARRNPGRAAYIAVRRGRCAVRRARATCCRCRGSRLSRAALGSRDRSVATARLGRRTDPS